MRQGDFDPDTFLSFLPATRPLQEQPGQFLRHGMRQAERTDHLVGALAVLAQVLRGMETSIGVALQKLQEIIPLHEIQLAGLQRLRRQVVGFFRHGAVKP